MRLGTRSGSMRDRRNTNLSISSTASTASSHTSPVIADHAQDSAEKGRFLWIPAKEDAGPLPSPLLKHARESQQGFFDGWQQRTPRWRTMVMLTVLAAVMICYSLVPFFGADAQFDAVFAHSDKQIDLINGAPVPDHPTPLIFQDHNGKPRWTISIPPSYGFPLEHHEYSQLCSTSEGVSKSVEAMTGRSRIQSKAGDHFWKRPYYASDRGFMSIDEAQDSGFLPTMPGDLQHISVVGRANGSKIEQPVCQSSMTFVMQTSEAGFGNTLLALWLSYGLAQKEGRAFFIDDSDWYDFLSIHVFYCFLTPN